MSFHKNFANAVIKLLYISTVLSQAICNGVKGRAVLAKNGDRPGFAYIGKLLPVRCFNERHGGDKHCACYEVLLY